LAAFLLATLDGAIFCAMSLSLYIRVPISCPWQALLDRNRQAIAAEQTATRHCRLWEGSGLRRQPPAGPYRWLPTTDRVRCNVLDLLGRRTLMLRSGRIATPAIVRSRSARA
jgi:hypothetical protein